MSFVDVRLEDVSDVLADDVPTLAVGLVLQRRPASGLWTKWIPEPSAFGRSPSREFGDHFEYLSPLVGTLLSELWFHVESHGRDVPTEPVLECQSEQLGHVDSIGDLQVSRS